MRVIVLFFIHTKDLVMRLDQSDYSSLSKLLIELKHILDVKLRALENIYSPCFHSVILLYQHKLVPVYYANSLFLSTNK